MPATRRARQLTTLLVAAALLATVAAPAGGTTAQGARAAAPARLGRERPVAVTLLTGDKVLLRQRQGGRQAVQVVPAPRRGPRPPFQVVSVRGDLHVIPGDVHHLVGRPPWPPPPSARCAS
jgi:hypothetical protein